MLEKFRFGCEIALLYHEELLVVRFLRAEQVTVMIFGFKQEIYTSQKVEQLLQPYFVHLEICKGTYCQPDGDEVATSRSEPQTQSRLLESVQKAFLAAFIPQLGEKPKDEPEILSSVQTTFKSPMLA
ncbi:hypothetical protein [Leptolyngbya sp. 7M]|uniref:hypothetical protein n=1 Tax=Leptolyngbya sp. 7M TaxID=2812896 RepID=UPI001B8C323A|nr:hypothetical protein [Leptolyngbya sp. 7M]QYO64241.1 hypothetical protein JVX88_31690 [Leptolyngbya sp. 7M]